MKLLAAVTVALFVWVTLEGVAGRPLTIKTGGHRGRRRSERQIWLSQAGAAVTPRQFWAVSAACAASAFLVLFALDRTFIVAAVPAGGAGALPYAYWNWERQKRSDARYKAWPEALRHISGGLQAGIANLHDALEELSVSGPEALRAPFARYVRLVSRGISDTQALEAVRTELANPVSDAVILNLELAASEGTSVAVSVLSDLASQITADLELAERIRTIQTQSRIAAWGVFLVPYGLLVFLCATQHFYRSFYSSPFGLVVVAAGAVLSVTGFAIVRRMARTIPTTERVFVNDLTQPPPVTVAGGGAR